MHDVLNYPFLLLPSISLWLPLDPCESILWHSPKQQLQQRLVTYSKLHNCPNLSYSSFALECGRSQLLFSPSIVGATTTMEWYSAVLHCDYQVCLIIENHFFVFAVLNADDLVHTGPHAYLMVNLSYLFFWN